MRKYGLSAGSSFSLFTPHAMADQNPGFTQDTVGFYKISLPNKNTVWAVCYDGKGGRLPAGTSDKLAINKLITITR
ncbi:MAG: hypothetical protein EOO10_14065 [Chitinophagaceae bacterium]|nr:MAG: hypothetical protein EOO10_14065 [Chitinophagaceae bacterium]